MAAQLKLTNAQVVTIQPVAQTSGPATLSIPDLAGVDKTISVLTTAQLAVLATLLGASSNGQSLITAADYAAMRTLLGHGRTALAADLSRTNATPTNAGLDVTIGAAGRYRITYRLYATVGAGGLDVALTFPAPARMSGSVYGTDSTGSLATNTGDWQANVGATGDVILQSTLADTAYTLTIDFLASGAGTLALLISQTATNAGATTLLKTSAVEWVKF